MTVIRGLEDLPREDEPWICPLAAKIVFARSPADAPDILFAGSL